MPNALAMPSAGRTPFLLTADLYEMVHRLLVISIAAVLLMFFSVPLGFMVYGGAGFVLFSLVILGALILLQLPVFLLLRRLGALSPSDRIDDAED